MLEGFSLALGESGTTDRNKKAGRLFGGKKIQVRLDESQVRYVDGASSLSGTLLVFHVTQVNQPLLST